jgi:hypothetical protein
VLNLPTPKLFLIEGLACRILSYIIMKNDRRAATLNKCPADEILCHPPRDDG